MIAYGQCLGHSTPLGCPLCGRRRARRSDAGASRADAEFVREEKMIDTHIKSLGANRKMVESDSAFDELRLVNGAWKVVSTTYKRKRLGCGSVVWKEKKA